MSQNHGLQGPLPALALLAYNMYIYSLLERWRVLLPRKVSITVRFSSPQQQAMHATENRLTRISLAIVWMFIFCHIWKLIPTVYEAITAEEVSKVRTIENRTESTGCYL